MAAAAAASSSTSKSHLLKKRPDRRSVSLTQRPLLLFGSGRPSDDEQSDNSDTLVALDDANLANHKKKDKEKEKRTSKSPKTPDLTPPAPAQSQSQPVSPRSTAMVKRRHDAERGFRDDVLTIMDAQQLILDRLTEAVETLVHPPPPPTSSCCVLL
jgi:hypothetical protein